MNGTTHNHVIPIKVYLGVWAALTALTVLTVAASFVHLGFISVMVALGIATIKATLVALFFMHLLYDEKFNLVVLVAGLLFVAVFFAFTLIDPLTRGTIDPITAREIKPTMERPSSPLSGRLKQERAAEQKTEAAPPPAQPAH